VIDLPAGWVAEAAGARLAAGDPGPPGPARAVVDSREVGEGDLFVGLSGARADGGDYADRALEAGAWGALVTEQHAERLTGAAPGAAGLSGGGRVLAGEPLAGLQSLARGWRRELRCRVIGITGSTGKTSTKDILAALLAPHLNVHANRENRNTEVGLPLSVLEAPPGTHALVLEMAMRGAGQIAELASIAEPDLGLIVNVGPVHLELMGTVEAVAAAKAELIADLPAGAACVVPAGERLLTEHLRDDLVTTTFGPAGDVALVSFEEGRAEIDARGDRISLELPYDQPHNVANTVAAVAAAVALGVRPEGRVDVRFSGLRGELVELPGGVTAINDCYNANPISMRAALDHLAGVGSGDARRIAVLGGMAELGEGAPRYHREVGEHAAEREIDLVITVGEQALPIADGFGGESHAVATPEEAGVLLGELAEPGDWVLLKASRSVGLERALGAAAAA
jgi:UDP-N-acetylmuramoyl-tripeptide--D-alanyl-D-alanine ligase